MRIIAGEFRGRRLRQPDGKVRPTTDRVREALFSILDPRLRGARVLDLFAGSGSLGLEALSRGASSVDFVEISRGSEKVLRENVAMLKVEERVKIIRADAVKFAGRLDRHVYDVAFADPPYGTGLGERVRDTFVAGPFAPILCIEHRTGEIDGANHTRRYGDTEISFFEDD